jgi:hypothetical protein
MVKVSINRTPRCRHAHKKTQDQQLTDQNLDHGQGVAHVDCHVIREDLV